MSRTGELQKELKEKENEQNRGVAERTEGGLL